MFNRILNSWVYGGSLAALMLLALTPVLSRGWSFDLLLIWLQLPIYMLHQFEEHDNDSFRRFVNTNIGGGKEVLSHLVVFVVNIGGVWGVDALAFCLAARVHLGLGLIAVYLSLVNSVAHCAQAVAMRRYNPGLVTSIVFFLPLGVGTLWVLAGTGEVSRADHVIGLAAALLVHAAIISSILIRKRQLAYAVS